jgi:TRAP-type uncharacterized transport system substrate-binding protein
MCQAKILGPILAALLCGADAGDATAQSPTAQRAPSSKALGEVVAQAPSKAGAKADRPAVNDPTSKRLPTPRSGPLPPQTAAEAQATTQANLWTVGLAAGLPEGLFLRFGAEIARNLNGAEPLRVLPMVTPGATSNIKDLIYLKGVDIAITHADVFEHFKKSDPIPNLERRISYLSELYISEVHLLVRSDINSIQDLAGKKVSFHTAGAGPSVTGPILFERLGVKIEPVYINNAIALEKMKTGEIAGLLHTVGKPVDLFTKFKNDAGFKFLAIPFDKFEDFYVPSTLTSEDYPGYIKPGQSVEIIGVPAVLAVYNWPRESERFRRLQRFVDAYFDKFDEFRQAPYHPKWRDINLAGRVPGWARYWYADEKIRQPTGQVTSTTAAAVAAPRPSDADQERLYQEFLTWKRSQGR